MKTQKQKSAANSGELWPVFILAAVLAILFWRSFLPEFVAFSNDGPLGQQNAAAARLPEAFLGTWYDNNDIGNGGGAWAVSISALFRWAVGPVGYAKYLVPFALFILGLGAYALFRQLQFSRLAATLASLAAALNSTFFAIACWGVAPQEIAIGMDFFALALVASIKPETPRLIGAARLALAGLCVGMNVMEAADIGAIFSLFVSAFIVVNALNQSRGNLLARLIRGVVEVGVVAAFAALISFQSVVSLVGTQIQGVAGTGQDTESKAVHWEWATMWSLPKEETLGLFVPGLFGYKMDTPLGMPEEWADSYKGGNYWGGMGREPDLDPYFAGGRKGPIPEGQLQWRQTSGTNYAGILVVLLAFWAAAQSFRKGQSVYAENQRRMVWFWAAVAVVSVLFAWGRFSVFYALLYKLPYFSTIRSPTKFLIVFSWAIVILFGYGLDGFLRALPAPAGGKRVSWLDEFKLWWTTSAFDRRWFWGCMAAVAVSLVAWRMYASKEKWLEHYLVSVGFPNDQSNPAAALVAKFSIEQAGWFVLLLALATALCFLVASRILGGKRVIAGGVLLGLFLLVDLGRADLPYIIHWDYRFKYDIDHSDPSRSSNPILNFLKDKSYERRVVALPATEPPGTLSFMALYQSEWLQHQFPYYNIQSLDNWQRPRVGTDIDTYEKAIYSDGSPQTIARLLRQWQLTNTRYIFAAKEIADELNDGFDPAKRRFQIALRFNVVPKPGVAQPIAYSEITAVPDTNGAYAVIDFTGALPRAKMYSNWLVDTNDGVTLDRLGNPNFDPEKTVFASQAAPGMAAAATNGAAGTVSFTSYAPTHIVLEASTPVPGILLLNDKYDPNWSVTVDGRPAPVLRCNFIMRGVYLQPGRHTVEYSYMVPSKPLWVTLAGFAAGIGLGGYLLATRKRMAAKPAN